jgi:hypothetical protein
MGLKKRPVRRCDAILTNTIIQRAVIVWDYFNTLSCCTTELSYTRTEGERMTSPSVIVSTGSGCDPDRSSTSNELPIKGNRLRINA